MMTLKSISPGLLLVLVIALSPNAAATGSDAAKEARWAEQVVDSLLDGDELWLDDGSGHEFLGILTAAATESRPAVVLLHGIGVHPNWPDIIYPLRTGLFERDVTTLSIQMPILANEADPRDYAPLFAEVPGRIDAALQALHAAGYRDLTLVAHSLGAAMAVYYLSQASSNSFDSLVIIGMSPGLEGMENIERLQKLALPVFDLYGGNDLEAVLATTGQRAQAGERSGAEYRQLQVPAANHFFQGNEAELVQQVFDWIEAHPGKQGG